ICGDLCPFSAITFDERQQVTEINRAICQGCGVCAAACPAGAITATAFTNEEILGQIEGLLTMAPGSPAVAVPA
ncbi:MAG TPA: 4Fe-4S dicluster domain-containing protein, partial [Candidatus Limnocylindrales bacterium]